MADKVVKKGDTVSVEYTGKLETGETFDSSKGKDPLEFEAGAGKVIKGFDEGIIGMKVGEEKELVIEAENAYGKRSDKYLKEVPRNTIPEKIQLKKGIILMFKREDGMRMPSTVTEVNDKTIKIDFNHPLAGKKLIFNIKIITIK